jgi:hypothetical protein
MHRFGFDWFDIILNTAALSLVPGVMAYLGGHLAAEAFPDQRRKLNWRIAFLGLLIVGVGLTAWQQVRASSSDAEKKAADAWQQALDQPDLLVQKE